jgi:ATP-dependent RNA helicase DDX24/MAK5
MSSCLLFSPHIFSLEVIPGDSYQVQKVGDDQTGFVTKVVLTKNEQEHKHPPKPKPSNTKEESKSSSSSEEKKLSKKERQKLKRKAKKEAAKERKRLKKTQEGEEDQATESATEKQSESQDNTNEFATDESLQQEIEQLQTTWSVSAVGVTLHTTLCTGLHSLKYTYPTPIQSSTLSAAILGRRDIVGAAPTGSGKTLSFGLPILQYLLDEADKQEKKEESRGKLPLQALILTPTRELAMQVTEELKRASCNKIPIGTILGGFAEVKQKRVLEKTRPPILVATPGRLWELVRSSCF